MQLGVKYGYYPRTPTGKHPQVHQHVGIPIITTMASRKEIEENLGDDSENLYGYIKAGLKSGLPSGNLT